MIKAEVQALAIAFIITLQTTPSESAAQSATPCHDDAREFCRNLEPSHGALLRCLQEHSGDLSSECRAHLQERSARMHERVPTRAVPRSRPAKDN